MLLINPVGEKFGGFLSRYVPVGIPMGMGYLAGYMLAKGVRIKTVDEEIFEVNPHSLLDLVAGLEKPYIFGLSVLTPRAGRAYELIRMLKALYPNCTVLTGGNHPTACPEESIFNGADIVVRGEGEEVLWNLYQRIRGNGDFLDIQGITYRDKNGAIVKNPDAPLISDIDQVPLFPFHLFEHPKYDKGCIVSSRGCPYRCNYCQIRMMTGTAYRFHSPDRIVAELDILINKYRQTRIVFYDDNFCFRKQRVEQVAKAIIKAGFQKKCSFSLQTRADNFYKEVVPLMAEAGFKHVGFGMETALDHLYKIINKGETVQQHIDAINLAHQYGMTTALFMIFGLPTETHEDREKIFKICQSLRAKDIKFNNLIPYPGTPMYETLKGSPRLHVAENWSNFNSTLSVTRSIFDKTPIPYVPETMSEFELKRDIMLYSLRPYFNWKNIGAILYGSRRGAVWITLPRWWYLNPLEIFRLCKLASALFLNLLIAWLPLKWTEPIMTCLNPNLKKRLRVPNAPSEIKIMEWTAGAGRQLVIKKAEEKQTEHIP